MAFAGACLNEIVFTRGAPKVFANSEVAERGFCAECGTPPTYRLLDRDRIAVTLGSLDNPQAVAPEIEFGVESKLGWLDAISRLPAHDISTFFRVEVRSRQHPDHDD